MSTRVQVILDEEEAARFRQSAKRESVSLSSWLREAGRRRIEAEQQKSSLKKMSELQKFFEECDRRTEEGQEPEWLDHKKVIAESYSKGNQA